MPANGLAKLLACLIVAFVAACAQPQGGTLYRDFTLIDGSGAAAMANAAMLVNEAGQITWVGPQAEAPGARTVVTLDDAYVIPGLIDLHVHLGVVNGLTLNSDNFTEENVGRELATYASYGVTSVLTMGTDKDLIFALREAQRAGRPDRARIFTTGQGIVFRTGYGGVPGVNEPVSTPEEAARAVALQAQKGVDFIKFWVDAELGTMPPMPPEISQAIINAAHAHNLRAVAHIFYLEDAQRLVDQGVDGLVHGVRDREVDERLIAAMRERGVWQIAQTLSREASMFVYGEPAPFLTDPFFLRGVAGETVAELANPARQARIAASPHFHDFPEFLGAAQRNLMLLKQGGVAIAFGTDSGAPARFPGYFAHWELQLMVEAGFTPLEAITAATGHAAAFLQDETIGVIMPGRWADFVVLEADPVEDIMNTRAISAVYIAGQEVWAQP